MTASAAVAPTSTDTSLPTTSFLARTITAANTKPAHPGGLDRKIAS